jgi:hypothetical protein
MKIKFSILLITAIFLSACEIPGAVLATPSLPSVGQPVVTPGCISREPTQADIDHALTYAGKIFSGIDWVRSYTVETNRVYVTWSNGPLNALAFTEALIFECGYTDSDIDAYFSGENWNTIFANYESYQAISECKSTNKLRLYQFTAQKAGFEYAIKYWTLNDTDTRVMELMIVFPVDSKSLMDEFSSRLFPELTSCK